MEVLSIRVLLSWMLCFPTVWTCAYVSVKSSPCWTTTSRSACYTDTVAATTTSQNHRRFRNGVVLWTNQPNSPNNNSNNNNEDENFLDKPFFNPDEYDDDDTSLLGRFANLVKSDYEMAETLYVGILFVVLLVVTQELLRMQLYGDAYIPFVKGGASGKLF